MDSDPDNMVNTGQGRLTSDSTAGGHGHLHKRNSDVLLLKTGYTVFEPRHVKTCLRSFGPGKTQTGLHSYRDKLES